MQQQRNGTGRRGKPWRLLRAGPAQHKKGPGAGSVPRRCVGTPGWRGWPSRPAELLALGYELAAISLGLRHALWLGLRVADGLGQHLAQLSLRLRRLAREGFLLPLGHERHVGMLEGKLNPLRTVGQMFHLRFCAKAEIDLEARCWSEWPYCWV